MAIYECEVCGSKFSCGVTYERLRESEQHIIHCCGYNAGHYKNYSSGNWNLNDIIEYSSTKYGAKKEEFHAMWEMECIDESENYVVDARGF